MRVSLAVSISYGGAAAARLPSTSLVFGVGYESHLFPSGKLYALFFQTRVGYQILALLFLSEPLCSSF